MGSLKDFLDASPTAFHAAQSISSVLDNSGFRQLDEADPWKLESACGYYVIRDKRAVIAFIPGCLPPAESGLRIAAAHLDSPLWKLKTEAAASDKGAWRYPVEPYGSIINSTWMDRELEVAGMVSYRSANGRPVLKAWRSRTPLAVIPSLALHFNRDVNKGVELNPQTHMAALIPDNSGTSADTINPLLTRICGDLNITSSDLLASELYLMPAQKAAFLGEGENRLIVSGRLDNLAMAHAILESLPQADEIGDSGILAAWFDAEEVGNRTAAGAASLFLDEIIERIVLSAGGGREELMRTRWSSFMVSADMAHAVHPNYADRHDPGYATKMGKGPVLKSHGLKHYATDVNTEGRIISAANRINLTLQKFISRSDLPCGYTLGPLASTAASISTVDIGNPLWAMHSARETASMSDHAGMVKLLGECWKS